MKSWLIKCRSGREFVVYRQTSRDAVAYLEEMLVGEIAHHVDDNPDGRLPYVLVDERKAPGA